MRYVKRIRVYRPSSYHFQYHQSVINNVRAAAEEAGKIVGLLLDTKGTEPTRFTNLSKGPEIRTGKLENGQDVHLVAGNKFTFTNDQTVLGNETKVSTTYTELPTSVKPGDTILVDDGLIGMTVDSVCTTFKLV